MCQSSPTFKIYTNLNNYIKIKLIFGQKSVDAMKFIENRGALHAHLVLRLGLTEPRSENSCMGNLCCIRPQSSNVFLSKESHVTQRITFVVAVCPHIQSNAPVAFSKLHPQLWNDVSNVLHTFYFSLCDTDVRSDKSCRASTWQAWSLLSIKPVPVC